MSNRLLTMVLLSGCAMAQVIAGHGTITGNGRLSAPTPPGVANCSDPTIHCLPDCDNTDVINTVASAAEQDTIILPVCNVAWTTQVRLTKKHVNIIGQGDGQTVITDNVTKDPACSNGLSIGGLPAMLVIDDTTYVAGWGSILVSGQYPQTPIRISGMTIVTGVVASATCFHIFITSGSHQLRIDHLSCTMGRKSDGCIGIDGDVWGVFDHLTVTGAPGAGTSEPILIRTEMWQAKGNYGDNSWAQPSTYGTVQQVTIEDSTVTPNGFIWCEYGSRCAVRNTTLGGISSHGTDSLGRYRSARHSEWYNDTFTCDSTVTIGNTTGVSGIFGPRGGTAMFWNNNVQRDGSTGCGGAISDMNNNANYYRIWQRFTIFGGTATTPNVDGSFSYRGACDGTSAFDDNTAVVASGVAAAASGYDTLVVSPSPNWTTNQWAGYLLHDVDGSAVPTNRAGTLCTTVSPNAKSNYGNITGPWGSYILSNTADTILSNNQNTFDCQQGGHNFFAAGDHYEIRTLGHCIDNVGWGMGALLDGGYNNIAWTCVAGGGGQTCSPPANGTACRTGQACGWVNEQLDPAYFWLDTITNTVTNAVTPFGMSKQWGPPNPVAVHNREFYNQNPTFNGAANVDDYNTGGVGVGTLAQRPASCTPQVGWWATDQNILYQCTATNTWSVHYQPLTYPHPFATAALLSKQGNLIETADGQVMIHLVTKKKRGRGKERREERREEKREDRREERQEERREQH